jgi:hypothetical protein
MDVMLDIETMGTRPGCPIAAIGAVKFDLNTGEIHEDHFSVSIELDGQVNFEGRTVEWWLKQSDAARKALLGGQRVQLSVALELFKEWYKADPAGECVWGNGATFDNAILRDAYEEISYGLSTAPWHWRDDRDVRTLVHLARKAGVKRQLSTENDPLTKHVAVADAIHQARYCSFIWKEMNASTSSIKDQCYVKPQTIPGAIDAEEIRDDIARLDGAPPYDTPWNTCWNDDYYGKSLEMKYGLQIDRLRKIADNFGKAPSVFADGYSTRDQGE